MNIGLGNLRAARPEALDFPSLQDQPALERLLDKIIVPRFLVERDGRLIFFLAGLAHTRDFQYPVADGLKGRRLYGSRQLESQGKLTTDVKLSAL